MKSKHQLTEIMNFIEEYVTVQLGSGVHTSRVGRNTRRIGEALGVDIRFSTFQKNAIISLNDAEDELHITRVTPIKNLPINFQLNSDLSALSWEADDKKLSLEEIKERFKRDCEKKHLSPAVVTLAVSLANASFCHLFGGDFTAIVIIFVSTFIGYSLKRYMGSHEVSNYLVVILASFVASIISSVSLWLDCNAGIALATSPLFLVPGVPLINGFIDIVEGYTLIGLSRLVNALLIIICIAVGLSLTLMLVRDSIL